MKNKKLDKLKKTFAKKKVVKNPLKDKISQLEDVLEGQENTKRFLLSQRDMTIANLQALTKSQQNEIGNKDNQLEEANKQITWLQQTLRLVVLDADKIGVLKTDKQKDVWYPGIY